MVVGDLALDKDTIVIGSGPGGYVAAIRAAQLGQQVTLIEKGEIGGVCLNVGCIPSKALINAAARYQEAQNSKKMGITTSNVKLDFKATQKWKDQLVVKRLTKGVEGLLKKNGVEIITGTAFFNESSQLRVINDNETQTLTFNHAIIATGSRPIEIPGFKFSERILDSTGALNLNQVPKKIIFIGGGYIGTELAGIYADFGSDVTIIEGTGHLLPSFETDLSDLVLKNFKKKKVAVYTNSLAEQVVETEKGVKVTVNSNGKKETLEADYVVVTVGRKPNTDELGLELAGVKLDEHGLVITDDQGRSSQPHIYAIGDITAGPALAHKASYEAKIVAEVISGKNVKIDYQALPAICFSDPEIASTGLTKQEAIDQKLDVTTAQFPFGANGRALSLDATDGFIRLVYLNATKRLIGAQVVGVGASEVINELTLAIEAQMTIEDLALTIHAHPSLAEVVMDAAELAKGLPIHF